MLDRRQSNAIFAIEQCAFECAESVNEMAKTDDNFWQNSIMSDETHFTLTRTVNKHKCRFYSTENLQHVSKVPL